MAREVAELANVRSPQSSEFRVCGSFEVGPAGSVVPGSEKGRGFTVTKETPDGQYTVQLLTPLHDIHAAFADALKASATDADLVVTGIDPALRRVTLQHVNGSGTAANPASGERMQFDIVCVRNPAR